MSDLGYVIIASISCGLLSLLVATLLVIGALTFVTLVPSLPASVGTFEFAVFYLLTTIGVDDGKALGFALVIHAILFIPPILIAIMVFATWAITGKGKPTQLAPNLATADPSQSPIPSD